MGPRLDRLQSKGWQIGPVRGRGGRRLVRRADVVGHTTPFFAPIAAVVSLGTSYGQRLRRVAEVTVGVAVGVFLADLIVAAIGSGGWQLTVIVALAMSTAILLDGGQLFMMQAAVQSIVVATLVPDPGAAAEPVDRRADRRRRGAGGGDRRARGAAARPREQAARVVRKVADLLRAAGDVMVDGEVDHALDAARRRAVDRPPNQRAARGGRRGPLGGGLLAVPGPAQGRPAADGRPGRPHRPGAAQHPRAGASDGGRGVPRIGSVPASYAQLCRDLADAADAGRRRAAADRMAVAARPALLAVGDATGHVERTADLNTDVVLAQIRSVVADLLLLTGLDELESTDALPPPPERTA